MRNEALVCLALALLLLANCCGGAPVSRDHFPGKIAAVVDPRGPFDGPYNSTGETTIYIAASNVDEYPLFKDAWGNDWWEGWRCPRWSQDGSRLAVVNWDLMWGPHAPYGYEGTLHIISADGTNLAEPTTTNSCAVWSPDGNSLLFSRWGTLYIMDISTKEQIPLIRLSPGEPQMDWSPHWSPDGTTVIYDTDEAIFEMHIDGTRVTRLVGPCDGCNLDNPRYSPDGKQIVFGCVWSWGDSRNGIYLMNRDGSQVTWLHSGFAPAWCPDGGQIAFLDDGRTNNIYVMDADGSGLEVLLSSQRWDFLQFDWGP